MSDNFIPIATLVLIAAAFIMWIEQLTGSRLIGQLLCAIPLGLGFGIYLINQLQKRG